MAKSTERTIGISDTTAGVCIVEKNRVMVMISKSNKEMFRDFVSNLRQACNIYGVGTNILVSPEVYML